jgi:two-component system, response regulator PdtaR
MHCQVPSNRPVRSVSEFLPLQRAADLLTCPQPCHAPSDDKTEAAVRPARILVVEDDYFVAVELEHRLLHAGFEVVGIAVTADEAMAMAAAHAPALAIMDIRLGGARDGIDAAVSLLRDFGIPSIFATAHSDPQTRSRAEAAKPLGWLEKPYAPATLIALITSVLAGRG